MKIGVLKLGSRVSYSSQGTSGGTGEAISIINALDAGGADVVVFTKVLAKDQNPSHLEFRDIETDFSATSDIDCLLVINGNVSFFGGAEDVAQLLNYQMINSFKGKVFYAFCDPSLTLKQVWPNVSKKPWGTNWTEEQLNVTRSDIIYLSQPLDTSYIMSKLGKNEVKPQHIIHFPFEKFPCMNEIIEWNQSPSVDLSYGGTMRGGRRLKKMIKFYFGAPQDISVEMFGKIALKDFPEKLVGELAPPTFTGAVKYDKMLAKMNQAMAHCVIGDPLYEKIADLPQRLYESIWSNVVTFIDSDMDKTRRVWSRDKELGDFLYISHKAELHEKIQLLKGSNDLRKQILDAQISAVNFDKLVYCSSLISLMRGYCDVNI